MSSQHGFILTDESRDLGDKHLIHFYGLSPSGPFEIRLDRELPLFFVERRSELPNVLKFRERKEVGLKSFGGQAVDALYFSSQKELFEARDLLTETGIRTFEADIRPSERFLMERFINGGIEIMGPSSMEGKLQVFKNPQIKKGNFRPSLKIISLDIETGMGGELYSIAYHFTGDQEVERILMVGNPGEEKSSKLTLFRTEREMLVTFSQEFQNLNPDLLIGWHVVGFDLRFIEKKCLEHGLKLNLGREGREARILEKKNGAHYAKIPGRVVIDGPPALRGAFYSFENFKLETVASELLGVGKDIQAETSREKVAEIERRFREDKEALAKYNLLDCTLVTEIYLKTGLVDLSLKRVEISGMLLDRIGASVAAFDHFFLPKIHRHGLVASNQVDIEREAHAAGGHVLEPEMGLHDHVIVLDFKSLYPSIIRTFKIDPLSRLRASENDIRTPVNVYFSKNEHILPDFISELLEERARAKRNEDAYLSQAIKILMNSFYGVMGSSGSRFYHADLPNAITGTGKWILLEAIDFLQAEGYQVVYGDTDSVFVVLKDNERSKAKECGEALAIRVNDYLKNKLQAEFKVESALDIEFEKHYSKFFLPPMRGGSGGAKKKYAGMLSTKNGPDLQFAGMEYVRSDWTKVAKRFQYELFQRLFSGDDIESWIKTFVEEVKSHQYDQELVYRKRLSKDPKEYTKNIPPHVRAALRLEDEVVTNKSQIRLKEIQYVMTRRGPMPIQLEHNDIDYQHYIEKQIQPLADNVLSTIGKSFEAIMGGDQLSLFE